MQTIHIRSQDNKPLLLFTILFCLFSTSTSCSGQSSGQSYWKLVEIKKVSGKAMKGATLNYMEDVATKHPYFKRTGERINFEFPSPKELAISDFTSFTGNRFGNEGRQEMLEDKLIDTITGISLKDEKTIITFRYNATIDQDKIFEAIYEKMNQEEYLKNLQQDKDDFSKQNSEIEKFVENYKISESVTHFSPLQSDKNISIKGRNGILNLMIPSGYYLKPSGDVTAYKFGSYQLGSFADNDIYNLINEKSGESVATVFITQAKGRDFKLQDYLSKTKHKLVVTDDSSFYSISPIYNSDTKTVEIVEHTFFRHISKGETQIFMIAENDDQKEISLSRQIIQSIQPK